MRVLVTRPRADAERTGHRLRERGHEPIIAPAFAVRFTLPDRPAIAGCSGWLVTSANGVRAAVHSSAWPRFAALPLFAVGDRTAEEARTAGVRHVVSAGGTAADLAARIIRDRLEGRLYYAAGATRKPDLEDRLAGGDISFTTETAYRIDPLPFPDVRTRQAIQAQRIDACLFTSAKTALHVLQAFDGAGLTAPATHLFYACISSSVGAVLRARSMPRIGISDRPDLESLIDLLDRYGDLGENSAERR